MVEREYEGGEELQLVVWGDSGEVGRVEAGLHRGLAVSGLGEAIEDYCSLLVDSLGSGLYLEQKMD